MLAEGRVQAEPLITHRFPLTEIGAAFVAADDKRASGAVKVVVQP
jgi:threonine dehydrogenase-like Zn-dependent dehydrogenase